MKKIRSEISSYRAIVEALSQEATDYQERIVWDAFNYEGARFYPKSTLVSKTPENLKQIGFMPMIIYDRTHLQQAMYPEGSKDHAHGLSKDVLLELPQMFNRPIAILTARSDDEDLKKQRLNFIFRSESDGKLYRAIVQPQDYHNGIVKLGYATKITSFHEIDSRRFRELMDDVSYGKRQIVLFDNSQYTHLPKDLRSPEFDAIPTFAQSIQGSYIEDPTMNKEAQTHKIALVRATACEINRILTDRGRYGTSMPLLQALVKTLETEGLTIKEYSNARKSIYQMSNLTTDTSLRKGIQDHADKLFAAQYVRHMKEHRDEFVQKVAQRIERAPYSTREEMQALNNEIIRLAQSAPTLSNLGVDFGQQIMRVKAVQDAIAISQEFDSAIASCMKEQWHQKIVDFNKSHTFDQMELSDPILPGNR